MATPSPKIDRRDFDAILKEVRELAQFYTPEWNARRETGPSAALLKVFAGLLEGLIRRLNDVPMRNFIAFFDRLGLKLLPAQPARAPLTFLLSAGAKEAVEIPARSQAAASPPGQEPIVFETEKAILATPAQLKTVLSVVPGDDEAFDHLADLQSETGSTLFAGENLQEHSLYLGHDDLFNLKGEINIEIEFSLQSGAIDQLQDLDWQYYAEREKIENGAKLKTTDWRDFKSVSLEKKDDKTVLKLSNANGALVSTDEIKQTEVSGIKSRWIRSVKHPLPAGDSRLKLQITAIKIGPSKQGLSPDAVYYNDIPLPLPAAGERPLQPFGPRPRQGDTFYLGCQEVFSKKGAKVALSFLIEPIVTMNIERVHGVGEEFTERLEAKGVLTIPQLLQLTPKQLAGIISTNLKRAENILEAAAKRYYDKVITRGEGDPNIPGSLAALRLSWEYWNGSGWTLIKNLEDHTYQLLRAGRSTVTFTCPDDLSQTRIAGQENYWIRVRIAFGDYGTEEIKIINANSADPEDPPKVEVNSNNIFPPKLLELTLGYCTAQPPAAVVTHNNLQFRVETSAPFSPFAALADRAQSLYLGFDQAPIKGPISIFFSLLEQEYPEKIRPRLEWEYFRRRSSSEHGEWARLLVEDGTQNLIESGMVQFIGPPDFARETRFGQSLFWIRAVNVENHFHLEKIKADQLRDLVSRGASQLDVAALVGRIDLGRLIGRLPIRKIGGFDSGKRDLPPEVETVAVKPQAKPCAELQPCEEGLQTFHPNFSGSPNLSPPPPVVKAIHLNTTWAIQSETINDEITGSGNGLGHQAFTLTKFPVISETVWVNEFGSLTESERKTIVEAQSPMVNERKDSGGNVTAFWVQWRVVDDLTEAGANDRVFELDSAFGRLRFGDGIHGRTLPIGRDNVKATYQAGGGARGNVDAKEIKALRTTIPSVDSVLNPEPAGGGSDTETVESALERGPQMLRHRHRAITDSDFESLAREASRSVARAKCLPNFNDLGETETGWVTVIIVPQSPDARPTPSPQLRARVEKSLRDAAANVAGFPRHVKVNGPVYVEVSITADLFAERIDLAPQVESAAIADLQKFLHPLSGGYESRGWEFGRLPCLSDFHARLEAVSGVDHTANVKMSLQAITPTGLRLDEPRLVTEDQPLAVEMPQYVLIFSGDHKLTVKALG